MLEPTAALQPGDGVDELHRDDFVVLHPHLRRDEHAPGVFVEVSENVHVKLHGGGG